MKNDINLFQGMGLTPVQRLAVSRQLLVLSLRAPMWGQLIVWCRRRRMFKQMVRAKKQSDLVAAGRTLF